MRAALACALTLSVGTAHAFPPGPSDGEASQPEPEARQERTGPGDWLAKFPGPQDGFMLRLQSLCGGERYAGRLVSDDPEDAAMRGERLVIGPAECTIRDERLAAIAIPFAVGDDASRTWRLSRTASGVRLRHRHALPDGTEDPASGYGGVADGGGTFTRQAFPVDAETGALFEANGLSASLGNVWAVEVVPGDALAYEMTRPGRRFRAEFDLAQPLDGGALADDQAARAVP